MKTHLFFDDNRLFGKDNLVRKYGKPHLIAEYNDGVSSTDYASSHVFLLDNGKYRMLYFAHGKDFAGKKLFAATSDDGIHFAPEMLFDLSEHPEKKYEHEIMDLSGEIASIFEDKLAEPSERYKMIFADCSHMDEFRVVDSVYTSADLIHWNLKEGSVWGDGTEPLANVFYNSHKNVYTVMQRPFWGQRCAGYKETADWKTFSEYRYCMNVDSLDGRLDEIYGTYGFSYGGMYIGLVHLYRYNKSEFNAKFNGGIIDTQLAYSYDGRYWQRSLREPFISGVENADKALRAQYNLVWATDMLVMRDGSINFYVPASELEHGPAFRNPGTGNMLIYNMRKDGFICLSTQEQGKEASVITREKVWHGGEAHINIKANKATVAVYTSDELEKEYGNVYGKATPLEGYSHDDCVPFEGDSTDWVPEYKSGRTLDELKDKTLVFEIRFTDGELYSLSGEYTDVFNTQGARYRKFGVLPE